MDQFDAFFRRADLDRDGRISGAEAVAFFQGSNLPKPVLAQIWQHADQNCTGFLGRQEFYNALKLVTVAQTKRELTADIVKAALYGPASAKIPAPQINLTSLPSAQPNPIAQRPPTQLPGVVNSMGPLAPTQQPRVINSVAPRPSIQQPGSINSMAPRPLTQQPGVINSMAPRPPTQQPGVVNSMVSGPPTSQPGVVNSMQPQNFGIRSQMPPNAVAPPSVGPPSSAQYFAPQGTQSMRPLPPTGPLPPQGVGGPNFPSGGLVGPNPSNLNVSGDWLGARGIRTPVASSQVTSSNSPSFLTPRPSVGGNGSVSDQMFGGDMFSASQTSSKPPSSLMPANTASTPSAVAPVSSEAQTPAKIDPLGAFNAFTRQPTGAPVQSAQATPSVTRPSQQGPIQNLQGPTQAPNLSQPQWPKMTRAGVNKYMKVFMEVDSDRDGKITGEQARSLFLSWRLPREILKQVWDLSDQDNDSMLSLREFCIALYLMERYREGHNLPPTLPSNVLLDETLLSLTGPPYRPPSAGWAATPGSATLQQQQQQGMHVGQPVPHGPPRGAQLMQFNQQKGPVPSMDGQHLSNGGDQNISRSISQETAEAEKVGEDKVILDSREKMAFYRNKMQDLVLYKSRCDNRLNEITERALADKREAELLAKKYEEKYKQVAEVASKLTIEEASFRDIQERKMELNQALVKMEQGGSADGILQVRADRIQSDLEELLKALAERCKKNGINVKSTAVIELPQGWQPGVPETSAVWDEDWDKFEDEGFQFDVANAKSTQPEISSQMDDISQDSYSNTDGKSEKRYEAESAYAHSEDELAKSPAGSPTTQKIFESPTKEDSFGKNFDAETERSFDDQGWGTFDNNDDVDSLWGFNNDTSKDAEHGKHGESYFFDKNSFTASPRRTDSPQGSSFFQTKSPFGFDDSVPGSPASRAATSPRYSMGASENSFFDNFSQYDSFSATDRGSPKQETFLRFDSMSSTAQDNNFSRFDSINSITQDNNFSRFDSMSSSTQDRNFARFDSMSSSVGGFDHGQTYSFDDFGSSEPFKVASDSQSRKNESDKWAF